MTQSAQSLPSPFVGTSLTWRDAHWLSRMVPHAVWQLLRARIAFERLTARRIVERNEAMRALAKPDLPPEPLFLARMAYVLPRISNRLPWRSDCLIQARAGQTWLAASGYPSEVRIGVETGERSDGTGTFGAHAWLVCGGFVVTGGDIARYHELLSSAGDDIPDTAHSRTTL